MMNKMKNKIGVQGLVKIGLVATIYILLTIAFPGISYGPIQARFSELLNFLAFIDPLYIPALVIGCAISNFYSFGLIDVLVGSFATFLSTYMMYKSRNMFVASLWPVINCIFIAGELFLVFNQPFWFNMITIGIGEFLVMTIIGYPIFKELFKNKKFVETILIDKTTTFYKEKFN